MDITHGWGARQAEASLHRIVLKIRMLTKYIDQSLTSDFTQEGLFQSLVQQPFLARDSITPPPFF